MCLAQPIAEHGGTLCKPYFGVAFPCQVVKTFHFQLFNEILEQSWFRLTICVHILLLKNFAKSSVTRDVSSPIVLPKW